MGRKPKERRVSEDVRSAALEQCDNIRDIAQFIKLNINELLTAKEASAMCGMSKSTFIRLSKDGKAPAGIKLGRLRRWRKKEIMAWIAAGCPNVAPNKSKKPNKPKAASKAKLKSFDKEGG